MPRPNSAAPRRVDSEGHRRNALESLLGLFTDVRAGEGLTVLLLFLDLFLTLTSYYVVKVVREPLILVGGGAAVKSYAAAGQALLTLLVVPMYGALANRVDRMRLVNVVTALCMATLVGFDLLGRAGVPIGVPFFLWIGLYNLMIVAQFWSFANDLFTVRQGQRLFPFVAAGGTLGAIVGAQISAQLLGGLGPYTLMLVAAGLVGAGLVLANVVHHRARTAGTANARASQPHEEADAPIKGEGGFKLLLQDRYLLLIALLVLVYNLVNTTGEFVLSSVVTAHAASVANDAAARGRVIGEFYGQFFTWVNVVAAVAQLFVVSRVLKWFGVRRALLVLPLIALGGYMLIAIVPLLRVVSVAKVLENSTDYSLQNTTRQALFLPTSRAAKYKAKAAIDTFCVRFGDVASAGLVFVGTELGLGLRGFAAVNAGLVGVWLVLAVAIGRRHRALTGEPRASRPSASPVPAGARPSAA